MIYKNKAHTHNLTLIALMTTMLCIISPFSLPTGFSPVPITFCTLGIYLSVFILGMKRGTLSCILYLLLGTIGLPVFSGFSGGLGKVLGPTGGYLIGYIFLAFFTGLFIDRWFGKWYLCFGGMLLGTSICYFFGTFWLACQMQLDLRTAFALGVLPYIPADLLKIGFALLIGIPIRKALIKADLLFFT